MTSTVDSTARSRIWPPRWLVPKTFTEAAALAAILAYGVTYFACVRFYSPLGVKPADVGLGYTDILAQAALYLAWIIGLAVLVGYLGVKTLASWRDVSVDDFPGLKLKGWREGRGVLSLLQRCSR